MFNFPYVDSYLGRYEWGMNLKNTRSITLSYFMGELTPQLFYQNYLRISASFGIKIVLWYARYKIPSY